MNEWMSLSRVQLFATPWTIQSMEFSRLGSPALQVDSLPTELSGKSLEGGDTENI